MINKSPSQIAQELNQMFTGGKASVTQLPGAAAPSTRQFYSKHKGYDLGVAQGTEIKAPFAGKIVNSGMDSTGYGQRIGIYNPTTNQTYYLSHLSKIATPTGDFTPGQTLAYTGGTPGSYGAGNTTGAHLDVEDYMGMVTQPLKAAMSYAQRLGSIVNPQSVLDKAKSMYGNRVVGVSNDPNKLKGMGRVVRITM